MSTYDRQGIVLALLAFGCFIFFVVALIRFITGDTRPRASIVAFSGSFTVMFTHFGVGRFNAIEGTPISTSAFSETVLIASCVGLYWMLMEFVLGRIFTRPRSHTEDWAGREVGQDGMIERRANTDRRNGWGKIGARE